LGDKLEIKPVSIHQNADSPIPSMTDGVVVEGPGALVSALYGQAIATSTSFATQVAAAVALGANTVLVQADPASATTPVGARFRLDTTAPTATVGWLIPSGSFFTMSVADASAALWIAATTGVTLNIWFHR
jgi:hypothetical protein